MPADDHPLLKDRAPFAESETPITDRPAFYAQAVAESVRYSPEQRLQILQNLEKTMLEDAGPLRERAQLLQLHRELEDAHLKMLSVKR